MDFPSSFCGPDLQWPEFEGMTGRASEACGAEFDHAKHCAATMLHVVLLLIRDAGCAGQRR